MGRKLWFGVVSLVLMGSGAWAVMGGGDISFPVPGMSTVLFSHDDHLGKFKLKCSECHYKIYTNHAQHKAVGMEGMRNGQSCGACHNGTRAFSVASQQHCIKCHK
jgi:c(7)-type cytochrome triheme protein